MSTPPLKLRKRLREMLRTYGKEGTLSVILIERRVGKNCWRKSDSVFCDSSPMENQENVLMEEIFAKAKDGKYRAAFMCSRADGRSSERKGTMQLYMLGRVSSPSPATFPHPHHKSTSGVELPSLYGEEAEEGSRHKLGIIYVIKNTITRNVKIGFTQNSPEKRLRALQTGNDSPLTVVGAVFGSLLDEQDLHELFSTHRTCGEWFTPCDPMLPFLQSAAQDLNTVTSHEGKVCKSHCVSEVRQGARGGETVVTYTGGRQEWYLNNILHRADGPAIVGKTYYGWYLWGRHHLEYGPAVSRKSGTTEWRFHGLLHRTGGPAIERSNTTQEWWYHGRRHRIGGPAIEYSKRPGQWYFHGRRMPDFSFDPKPPSGGGAT